MVSEPPEEEEQERECEDVGVAYLRIPEILERREELTEERLRGEHTHTLTDMHTHTHIKVQTLRFNTHTHMHAHVCVRVKPLCVCCSVGRGGQQRGGGQPHRVCGGTGGSAGHRGGPGSGVNLNLPPQDLE